MELAAGIAQAGCWPPAPTPCRDPAVPLPELPARAEGAQGGPARIKVAGGP